MRLNSDGSFDKSFGTAGTEIIDLGGSDTAGAIALQPDGNIILAGTTTSLDPTRRSGSCDCSQ
jgi:hypothetical protein